MRIGVHVSAAGHIYEAVNRARALGVTTMQLFSRDPRQWRKARLSLEDIEEFKKRSEAERSGVRSILLTYGIQSDIVQLWRVRYG